MQPAERAALVEDHAWIVAQFVAKYEQRGNGADLAEAGLLGLCEAARRFDSSAGVQFATYAWNWVKGAVLEEIRSSHLVPLSKRAALGKTQNDVAPPLVLKFPTDEVATTTHTSEILQGSRAGDQGEVLLGLFVEGESEAAADAPRRRQIARTRIADLPASLRPVALCALGGRSTEQIADMLLIPPGRVLYLLSLAEQHLQREAA